MVLRHEISFSIDNKQKTFFLGIFCVLLFDSILSKKLLCPTNLCEKIHPNQ